MSTKNPPAKLAKKKKKQDQNYGSSSQSSGSDEEGKGQVPLSKATYVESSGDEDMLEEEEDGYGYAGAQGLSDVLHQS
jgi:hypothetical protein